MTDLSFEDILKRATALPPAYGLFWHLMSSMRPVSSMKAMLALRQSSRGVECPDLFLSTTPFSAGNRGRPDAFGPDLSRLTVNAAIRILGGREAQRCQARAARICVSQIRLARDSRRWGISESNLPRGSQVLFREPSIWERYSWQLSLIACVILIQGAMISGLLHERRRRHLAEVESRQRLAELAHVNRYSAVGELTTSIAHETKPAAGLDSH